MAEEKVYRNDTVTVVAGARAKYMKSGKKYTMSRVAAERLQRLGRVTILGANATKVATVLGGGRGDAVTVDLSDGRKKQGRKK